MRRKLIVSFVLIVLVAVIGVVLAAQANTTTAVRAFMLRGGMTGPGGIVALLQDYYQRAGSWQGVEQILQATPGMHGQGAPANPGGPYGQGGPPGQGGGYGHGMMSQRLRLADARGRIVADSSGAPTGSFSWLQRLDALPIAVDGRTVGYLLPEGGMAGYNRADETYLVGRLTQAALIGGAIAAALALLLALALAAGVMRPVQALTSAAQSLGNGDLSRRVQVSGDDELAVLGKAFNSMADSLQQSQESRKALTADIAHELRTPLAVQRAVLEALQDGIDPLTLDSLGPIIEQNLLLTRLVDDLRTLAMAEAGELTLERVPTDVNALVERAAARFRPQAETHGIRLVMQPAAGALTLAVDGQRIDQILGNLLSNALRYTPASGQIVLRVEPVGTGVEIHVQDSGPGLPPEALEQVFERFYRLDRSRARHDGGAGLGLAIARRLAEAHGGQLTAANAPQGGAIFTLRL